MTVERKYIMTKLDAGDYLLPSNDGQSILRIAKYTDGPSFGLEDWPADKKVWGAWRYRHAVESIRFLDVDDWNQWEQISDGHDKRREAIDAALERHQNDERLG